jgi:hypothetical protein
MPLKAQRCFPSTMSDVPSILPTLGHRLIFFNRFLNHHVAKEVPDH